MTINNKKTLSDQIEEIIKCKKDDETEGTSSDDGLEPGGRDEPPHKKEKDKMER